MPVITLEFLVAQVQSLAPELDVRIERGANVVITKFADLLSAKSDQMAFLANPKYADQLANSNAAAIVTNNALWTAISQTGDCKQGGVAVTSNPYAFFAFASQVLEKNHVHRDKPSWHPTAIIDASASIDHNVQIGPFCVIGKNARVNKDSVLESHVVLGDDAVVGAGSYVYSHVTVYDHVQLGQRCIIHSGTVLGADGFGFAPYQKRWVKIPQTGTVHVGDDVEIGANCTIDRGALGNTTIGRGTKLDNLIQIAHNVQVGEDCAFAANVAIAGSALIGNRVQMGGKAGVLGHLSICDDVVISSCTLITKTITKPGFYSGVYPFQENADWEKNAVSLKRLNGLREQHKLLEKTVHAMQHVSS